MTMLKPSTIQLLRIHFSFFLLPVFLFALSQVPDPSLFRTILVFFILHFLVYPSSNGYNSYMDRDTTPIGALANPLQPTRELFLLTIILDIAATLLSLLISVYFTAGVLLYILASRAYSFRGIRLKKFPIIGYLIVVIFQGALVFCISYHGCSASSTIYIPLYPALASACLIGGYYPLTQIYQHKEDRKDGVNSISMMLGKKGTFIFCGCIFVAATLLLFATFYQEQKLVFFFIFLGSMLPMFLFFLWWMLQVMKDERKADFKNSLTMNILASGCTTICFILFIILKGIE
jgi:1,4-dihydroxy-2-naphthoate polyprenyltransferase